MNDSTNAEIWRDIPGYGGWYEASNLGRVRSWKNGNSTRRRKTSRILSQSRSSNGYLQVNLSQAGAAKTQNVHPLIALAFIGDRPPLFDTCHNNGDKTDNRLENIRYDTRAGNHADKRLHGTSFRNECGRGHVFTAANTGLQWNRDGTLDGRYCRTCAGASERKSKQRRRELRRAAA